MRIAIATAKIDPHHGGAESWTIGLANWLLERGHDVHLVGFKASETLAFPRSRVHCLPPHGNRLQLADRLSSWLRQNDFDIVHDMGIGYSFNVFHSHCGSLKAMEAAKRRSLSATERFGKQVIAPFATRKRIVQKLSAIQFSNSTASYVAVSQMVARDLCQQEGVDASQIQYVPNGVDVDNFHPDICIKNRSLLREKWNVNENELVIAVIAHNHRLKGVPQIIQMLRFAESFPTQMHLLVVGGHNQPQHQQTIGKHRVTYTGVLDCAMDVFPAIDVYLHPTFYDACCLAVLEAMSCGIATITSKANGAADRIENGISGLLIEDPKNKREMLAMLEICADPIARGKLGAAARRQTEKWTLESNYQAIESLYRDHLAHAPTKVDRVSWKSHSGHQSRFDLSAS